MGRYSRERMPPAQYLAASYYERWLFGLRTLLVEQGLVRRKGAGDGTRRGEDRDGCAHAPRSEDVANYLRHRVRARVDADVPPKFKPGDRVVTRNIHPAGHTRLPRYARGAARHDRPRSSAYSSSPTRTR